MEFYGPYVISWDYGLNDQIATYFKNIFFKYKCGFAKALTALCMISLLPY